MSTPLCRVVQGWPEIDRERWRAAQEPAGFLEADKPASRWGPARRCIVEQAYGQWLSFLDSNGALEPSCTPGHRATDARLSEFVNELRDRVAPVSAAMMLGALVRMLSALEPERDWGRWRGCTTISGRPRRRRATSCPVGSAPPTCSSWGCG